jgi:D-glycero-alpha-D-manno-heptose-7-phosphate kinase
MLTRMIGRRERGLERAQAACVAAEHSGVSLFEIADAPVSAAGPRMARTPPSGERRASYTVYRARAPLRISFAGGGTDVSPFREREGGVVLSTTINQYAYGSLRKRFDGQVHLESLDFGLTATFPARGDVELGDDLDLPRAAIRRLRTYADGFNADCGFDLFLHSSAPPGSGLGSSSAMMVTLVGAMQSFYRLPLSEYEVAELAHDVERKDLARQGGMQDHYASAFGGFNFIEFEADRVIVNPLRIGDDTLSELEYSLLLAFTGKTRSSDRIIEDQTGRYEAGVEDALAGLRAQKELAVEMKNALLRARLSEFGSLLGEAWREKKKMSPKISNPEIDDMYEAAIKAGALGGKVTGAGGGGYMLFYCEYDKKHRVAAALDHMGAPVSDVGFDHVGLRRWSTQVPR